MPDRKSVWGLFAKAFKVLLTGSSKAREGLRDSLLQSAARLDRARFVDSLPAELHESVSRLSRLTYLCLNAVDVLPPEAGKKITILADLSQTLERLVDGEPVPLPSVPTLRSAIEQLSVELLALVESDSMEDPEELDLLQRLELAEIRERLAAIETKKRCLSPPLSEALDQVCSGAVVFLEECKNSGLFTPVDSRQVKRYLGEAEKLAASLESVTDESVIQKSIQTLERIAAVFALRKNALAAQKNEDISVQLSVLDTLLRMDGK